MDLDWAPEEGKLFEVRIQVDVRNQRGVLARVAAAIANAGSNIVNVGMDEEADRMVSVLHFTIQVADRVHLEEVIRNVQRVPEVIEVIRKREKE